MVAFLYAVAPGARAAGPAVGFGIGGNQSATAGRSFNFPVNALGADGSLATDYRGTVHFTSSDPLASLPPDYTYTATDNGTHQFRATLYTGGSQSITVADTAMSGVTTSRTYTVIVPAATSFDVGTVPVSVVVGAPLSVVVKAVPFTGGQPDVTYRGTVTFTSLTDPGASLPVDYTFTESDAGTHVFCAAGQGSGCSGGVVFGSVSAHHTVTVTDRANPSLTGTSNPVEVTSNVPARLVLSGSSQALTGGDALVRVAVVNGEDKILTTFSGTVGLTSTDPLAVVPSDYTFTGSDRGEHEFFVRMGSVGTHTVTAVVRSMPSVTGTSKPIAVRQGPVTTTTSTTPALSSNARPDQDLVAAVLPTAPTVVPGPAGASGRATASSPVATASTSVLPATARPGTGSSVNELSPTSNSLVRPETPASGALARTGSGAAGDVALGALALAAGLWAVTAARCSRRGLRE